MPREVFISYCSANSDVANQVCEVLETHGVACWIAPRDIPGGQTWAAAIVGAIEECRVLLVIVSSHANRSRQMSREVELADSRKLRILPVRIEDVEPRKDLEYFMGNRQWIDLFPLPVLGHAAALVKAVVSLRDAETTTPVSGGPVRIEHKREAAVVVVPPASSSRNLYWLVAALAVVALASLWAMWLQRRDAYVEFLNEADQYSHAGMWLDAINWYDMALAKNPPVVEQAVIYDLRCQANAQAGMAEDALTDCLRAIRIGPANFKARLDTAALYAGAKQPDKALEQYQAALAIAVKAGDLPGQQIAKAKIGAIGK